MKQNQLFICVLVFLNISFSFSQSENKSLGFYISKATEFITKDNIDSILFYVNKIETIKRNKENYKEYIIFLSRVGHYYEGSGAFEKSIEKYQIGLKIAESYKDDIYTSKMLADISQTYRILYTNGMGVRPAMSRHAGPAAGRILFEELLIGFPICPII